MSTPLPRWERRDNFRRDPHQAVVDAVNELSVLVPATPGVEVIRTPFGSAVRDNRPRVLPDFVWVRVAQAAAGGGKGKYDGFLWEQPTVDVDPATDLTEAETGQDGDAALILNVREVGKTTNDLEGSGSFLPKLFPGRLLDVRSTDGRLVVLIDGYQWEDC